MEFFRRKNVKISLICSLVIVGGIGLFILASYYQQEKKIIKTAEKQKEVINVKADESENVESFEVKAADYQKVDKILQAFVEESEKEPETPEEIERAFSSSPYDQTTRQAFIELENQGPEIIPILLDYMDKSDYHAKAGFLNYMVAIAIEDLSKCHLRELGYDWVTGRSFEEQFKLMKKEVKDRILVLQFRSDIQPKEYKEEIAKFGIFALPYVSEEDVSAELLADKAVANYILDEY